MAIKSSKFEAAWTQARPEIDELIKQIRPTRTNGRTPQLIEAMLVILDTHGIKGEYLANALTLPGKK